MAAIITLDAGVIIAMLNEQDTHHEWATRLLIDCSEADFVMPALTYAECLIRPTQADQVHGFLSNIAGLGLRIVDLTAQGAFGVARVRAETKLRMPDAVVLSTALDESAWIATTDKVLAQAARSQGVTAHYPE
jgi:predicted nucleic acid-binding protein